MNAFVGRSAVLLGLLGCLAGVITLGLGIRHQQARFIRAGRSYAWLLVGAALLAALAMERALVTHDFSLTYVAQNGGRQVPLMFHPLLPLWGALAGSILLWTFILTIYIAAGRHQVPQAGRGPAGGVGHAGHLFTP